jgi:hypothetical protein
MHYISPIIFNPFSNRLITVQFIIPYWLVVFADIPSMGGLEKHDAESNQNHSEQQEDDATIHDTVAPVANHVNNSSGHSRNSSNTSKGSSSYNSHSRHSSSGESGHVR